MGRVRSIRSFRPAWIICRSDMAEMHGMCSPLVSLGPLFDAKLVISPGRFLAAHQLKTMLAHIVLMYDVKLEENATIPESIHVATAITVNPSVKVMFRRRY